MAASGLKKEAAAIVDNWRIPSNDKKPEIPEEFNIKPNAPRPTRRNESAIEKFGLVAVLSIWAIFIIMQ